MIGTVSDELITPSLSHYGLYGPSSCKKGDFRFAGFETEYLR